MTQPGTQNSAPHASRRPSLIAFASVAGVLALASCAASQSAQPSSATPEAQPVAAQPVAASTSYPMCMGQNVAEAGQAAPQGASTVQLAPAFLDQMSACAPTTRPTQELLAKAGAGVINAKGDCEFAAIGVSCHYHAGSEFINSSTKAQTPGQGELHCIFPSGDPASPSVFGGHIACKRPGEGVFTGASLSHEVKQGATCSAELLGVASSCQNFRCCDEGTLTNPIANLVQEGRNGVRPDFRICSDTLEVDCELLANLTPHTANSPALGGVASPVFNASKSDPSATAHH